MLRWASRATRQCTKGSQERGQRWAKNWGNARRPLWSLQEDRTYHTCSCSTGRGSGFWVVAVPGVSTPSPTLIPPASLHRGFHSASSLFLVLQSRSVSFSVFSIIPRNTIIFSMVLLRLATISSCTRREQGRTVALGTAFC